MHSIPAIFFQNHFLELTNVEKCLFFAMSYLSWGRTGRPDVKISHEELQSFCGLSHVTVSESLRSLEVKKLIAILEPPKKGSPTKYWGFGESPKNNPAPKTDIANWDDRKKLER